MVIQGGQEVGRDGRAAEDHADFAVACAMVGNHDLKVLGADLVALVDPAVQLVALEIDVDTDCAAMVRALGSAKVGP